MQRFYMLLRPTKPGGKKSRLCVVGKKRLPSVRRHEVGGLQEGGGMANAHRACCVLQRRDPALACCPTAHFGAPSPAPKLNQLCPFPSWPAPSERF